MIYLIAAARLSRYKLVKWLSMQTTGMKWAVGCFWVLFAFAYALCAQAAGEGKDDSFVPIAVTTADQREVMHGFEQYARAVLTRNFVKAHDFMDPIIGKQVSEEMLRDRYHGLEEQFGILKRIITRGIWMGGVSDTRPVMVVVDQVHEWKTVRVTYILRKSTDGWRVVAFRPGGQTPAGNIKNRTQN